MNSDSRRFRIAATQRKVGHVTITKFRVLLGPDRKNLEYARLFRVPALDAEVWTRLFCGAQGVWLRRNRPDTR